MNPRIKAVNPIDDYQLILEFTNGELGVYDCKHFLDFGVFKELRDINYFKQVTVTDGTVTWPHEQDICPDTLYLDSKKMNWLDEIRWTSDGLIPVIAQLHDTGKVLMFAWMNRESLSLTVLEGYAVYWSRSRGKLWRKGEESGHRQKVIGLFLDCDEDVILLKIEQEGGIACHTGRESCFYRRLVDGQWQAVEPVLKDPKAMYTKNE